MSGSSRSNGTNPPTRALAGTPPSAVSSRPVVTTTRASVSASRRGAGANRASVSRLATVPWETTTTGAGPLDVRPPRGQCDVARRRRGRDGADEPQSGRGVRAGVLEPGRGQLEETVGHPGQTVEEQGDRLGHAQPAHNLPQAGSGQGRESPTVSPAR